MVGSKDEIFVVEIMYTTLKLILQYEKLVMRRKSDKCFLSPISDNI